MMMKTTTSSLSIDIVCIITVAMILLLSLSSSSAFIVATEESSSTSTSPFPTSYDNTDENNNDECFPPSQRETCHSLTCINNTCQPCTNSDQCWQKVMICTPNPETGDGECLLQPLFGQGFDIWLMLTMICVLGVCTVGCIGGLGGGGAISPCIAGVAGFPMHDAVFLSLATIVGQALINIPAIMVCYDPEFLPNNNNNNITTSNIVLHDDHNRHEMTDKKEIVQRELVQPEEVIDKITTPNLSNDAVFSPDSENNSNTPNADSHLTAPTSHHTPSSSFSAPTRPLAALDMLVMWFPACAAGTFLGELISRIIPNWVRMACLFLLACAITYRTATRSLALRKTEQYQVKKADRRALDELPSSSHHHHHNHLDQEGETRLLEVLSSDVAQQKNVDDNHDDENHKTNTDEIITNKNGDDLYTMDTADHHTNDSFQQPHPDSMPRFAVLEIGLLILTIAIGVCVSHFILSGNHFECGSALFWGLIVVGTAIDLSVAIFYRARVARIAENVSRGITHRVKMSCTWNVKNSVVLPIASAAAGIGSQMFGLGGGSLVGPLLLEAGLPAERVSATGSVLTGVLGLQSMIVSAGGNFALPSWSYIIVFACIGAVSTVFGRFFALKEIKRRRATWLIVLCLSTILFLTMVASMTHGIITFVELLNYGAGTGMGRFCAHNKKK